MDAYILDGKMAVCKWPDWYFSLRETKTISDVMSDSFFLFECIVSYDLDLCLNVITMA